MGGVRVVVDGFNRRRKKLSKGIQDSIAIKPSRKFEG
jgi:hypothetical protein